MVASQMSVMDETGKLVDCLHGISPHTLSPCFGSSDIFLHELRCRVQKSSLWLGMMLWARNSSSHQNLILPDSVLHPMKSTCRAPPGLFDVMNLLILSISTGMLRVFL